MDACFQHSHPRRSRQNHTMIMPLRADEMNNEFITFVHETSLRPSKSYAHRQGLSYKKLN